MDPDPSALNLQAWSIRKTWTVNREWRSTAVSEWTTLMCTLELLATRQPVTDWLKLLCIVPSGWLWLTDSMSIKLVKKECNKCARIKQPTSRDGSSESRKRADCLLAWCKTKIWVRTNWSRFCRNKVHLKSKACLRIKFWSEVQVMWWSNQHRSPETKLSKSWC